MKKFIVLHLMLFCCTVISAQLTLEECYVKAQTNYPLIKQYDLIDKSKDYDL
jgi:hypothetical protein